jgi:hypothetical protein
MQKIGVFTMPSFRHGFSSTETQSSGLQIDREIKPAEGITWSWIDNELTSGSAKRKSFLLPAHTESNEREIVWGSKSTGQLEFSGVGLKDGLTVNAEFDQHVRFLTLTIARAAIEITIRVTW